MHVHLRSFKCSIHFTGLCYNIYANTPILINIYLYQILKNCLKAEKCKK